MDKLMKPPTVQDVARSAGVSAATVSRALSTPERVSEATRERVAEAIRETGYTLNQAARSLRRKAAHTILLAAPRIGNPFYSSVVDTVIQEAKAAGYGVLIASSLGDDPSLWAAEHLLSNRADGLLLFDHALDTDRLREMGEAIRAVPLVVAFEEVADPLVNSVITDNYAAAWRMVEHLYGLGHREIGHIAAPIVDSPQSERSRGFVEAMQALGLPVRPEWMFPGDFSLAAGVRAADGLIACDQLPSAMMCSNDDMAVGCIAQLRRAGIDCPADISVSGFDDIDIAPVIDPPLTTMRQPRDEIGRRATRMLIDIMEGNFPAAEPTHIVLSSELVTRASTQQHGLP